VLFNSPLYGAFLVACFAVAWALRKQRLARALFLLAVSYGFYFYGTFDAARGEPVPLSPVAWSALCLSVIFVGSSLDYFIGRALGRVTKPGLRKALLLVSIAYYLGVLSIFKYWNFAADSIVEVAHWMGFAISAWHVRLVLPFGISFFTFETMSYTIDVYRRQLEPADRYLDYLLFVCFFPHLVAGPIVRAKDMLPQFRKAPVYDPADQARGLFMIATGLVKKVAIGDVLAANMVGRVFENPERFSSLEILVGVYAYAVQIYADFSGYTDVALGSAKLFGYQLPINFAAPYTAHNLQDFWHRWHISLSSWLRDYLYKPLGGSRKGTFATYRNLMVTMLLGGLWHGASWNFVIWGGLHGGVLAATRAWQRRFGASAPHGVKRAIGVFLTFHFVCFGWVFFRARTLPHAWAMLAKIGNLTTGSNNLPLYVVVLIGVAMLLHFLPSHRDDSLRDRFARAPAYVQGFALALVAIGLHFAAGSQPAPFVYGQF
jgi:D-alanyl-lipoteichoic acid acyltransferase DltB (MBOAT superfamily)